MQRWEKFADVDAKPQPSGYEPDQVLIVFVDGTECRALHWLKQGFRHCFVAMRWGKQWVICDPLKNHIEFSVGKPPHDLDLGRFYRERGFVVLTGHCAPKKIKGRPWLEPLTCVAIVKRIIGLRAFWVLTPWQLYRMLIGTKHHWRLAE